MKLPKIETVDPLAAMPSTMSYVGYHAAWHPEDLAVIVNGREIAYSALHLDIGKMVTSLRSLGLSAGQTVAVGMPDTYLHLLVVFAFEALGVITFSYHQDEVFSIEDRLAAMDLVMCPPGQEPSNAERVQAMDEAWFDTAMAEEPDYSIENTLISLDAPLWIVKSSGTTGNLKWMVVTARAINLALEHYEIRGGFNRHSRFLMNMGFNMSACHYYATGCLRMGGTCVYPKQESIEKALAKYMITHAMFLPHILEQVLDGLPKDYVKAPNLTIFTHSGAVSNSIRARTKLLLADEIIGSYSTSEIGVICAIADDGAGAVMPGVQVEVVNNAGQPVLNEPGLVRIKSPGSVGGYIDDPETTQRMFRNGWFYPGDVAVMMDNRTLKLLGRADDVLNIQGVKFSPQSLEKKLLDALPVDDLCLTTMVNDEGVNQVWVVVVLENPDKRIEIEKKITSLMPGIISTFELVSLKEIPRTANGKIQRNKLNEILWLTKIDSETL
jgi:acyl-coenzyme A synthetase/AMP-(fatty) acid ligase